MTIKIRSEQVQVFEQAAVRNFEDRMIEHLREFVPRHFKMLEEADFRKIIQYGWERAKSHRLTSERSVRIYIQLVLMLGSSFDSDPQMPWAAEILNDESIQDETERIDRLHDKAWDYADYVALDYGDVEGDVDSSRFVEKIRQIRRERNEVLQQSDVPEFYKRMIMEIKQTFPKKCEYIGELSLRRLIQRGIESAKSYGITIERGVVLFVSMMFVLGSGFDTDPRLPWASAILNDPAITDQSKRVDQLLAGAVDCLKRWWACSQ